MNNKNNNIANICMLAPVLTTHPCALPCLYVWVSQCARRINYICGMTVDLSGAHGLSSRKSVGRGARDTDINSIVKTSLSSAEIPNRLEPRGLARDDGKRPDGVTSMSWKNGRCLIWDVACPDTPPARYLYKAVTSPGVVATEAEKRKRQKYSSVDDSTHIFKQINTIIKFNLIQIAIETEERLAVVLLNLLTT